MYLKSAVLYNDYLAVLVTLDNQLKQILLKCTCACVVGYLLSTEFLVKYHRSDIGQHINWTEFF